MIDGVVQMQASASDNVQVTSVAFYAGSTHVGTDTSAPFVAPFDSAVWPDGQTSAMRAVATDAAGNTTTSDNVYVMVDHTPGTTTTTTPTTTTATTTTATTTTAPTTTTSAPTGSKLSWAPPALTNPITINVPDTGVIQSGWPHVLELDKTRDYIVKIGHRVGVGGISIVGGHNVVIIGGRITIPTQSTPPSSAEFWRRNCMTLKETTGVIHIEGLLCDGEPAYLGGGSELTEGIIVWTPNAQAIQLQNVRVVGTRSFDRTNWADNHPNVVQCWACPPVVRIDKLTGESDYEGMQLCHAVEGGAPPEQAIVRRVNIKPSYPTLQVALWPCATSTRFTFDQVYLRAGNHSGGPWGLQSAVGCRVLYNPWRCVSDGRRFTGSGAPYAQQGDYVEWPNAADNATGRITYGDPAGGDFVPAGAAGTGYVSPGYN